MITVRVGNERGVTRFGWLDSRHTFSFGEYYDPAQMGFESLRVINDDKIEAGQGFGMHPHNNMEIITVVTSGALQHADSMGNRSLLKAGEVQRMSAGTGILHSEFNASDAEPVELLQIWILPERHGLTPGYEQRAIAAMEGNDALKLIAGAEPRGKALKIHQAVNLYYSRLQTGEQVQLELGGGNAWLQLIKGELLVNGTTLQKGDGAAIKEESELRLQGESQTEALIFHFLPQQQDRASGR